MNQNQKKVIRLIGWNEKKICEKGKYLIGHGEKSVSFKIILIKIWKFEINLYYIWRKIYLFENGLK